MDFHIQTIISGVLYKLHSVSILVVRSENSQ
jgi:hypothetical protein